uniref:Uncharacterized protein n=1 Tax=Steinernema glaseri TaxID=37863 RepID=A0A1I7YJ26_9BILA
MTHFVTKFFDDIPRQDIGSRKMMYNNQRIYPSDLHSLHEYFPNRAHKSIGTGQLKQDLNQWEHIAAAAESRIKNRLTHEQSGFRINECGGTIIGTSTAVMTPTTYMRQCAMDTRGRLDYHMYVKAINCNMNVILRPEIIFKSQSPLEFEQSPLDPLGTESVSPIMLCSRFSSTLDVPLKPNENLMHTA